MYKLLKILIEEGKEDKINRISVELFDNIKGQQKLFLFSGWSKNN